MVSLEAVSCLLYREEEGDVSQAEVQRRMIPNPLPIKVLATSDLGVGLDLADPMLMAAESTSPSQADVETPQREPVKNEKGAKIV